ncbi:hypothetical protein skT53_05820 [Effusibacillus dendaii]|uniref:Uncharacterized protein n=1 Tax=Effusibacillus dendaii TaxID=2743772 RepID=A0A7I8D6H4_9BACL|nr:hypothetical protein skT53_05820 [Effusibacillus dendaii]
MEYAVLGIKRKSLISPGWLQGIFLTIVLAIVAKVLVTLPFLSIMGQLVIAILLGIAWRAIMGIPETAQVGISFFGKNALADRDHSAWHAAKPA